MRSNRISVQAAAAAALLAAFGLAAPALGESTDSSQISETRSTLDKWVETQRVISKEKSDWAMAREVLEQRIDLLSDEAASLEQKIRETQASVNVADAQRRELLAANAELKEASASLDGLVAALEAKLVPLVSALPAPVADRIQPLSQRLPEAGDEKKPAITERFQNVIGILNEVNKFNGEISVSNEIRELPGGVRTEVRTIYLGLGQGYYVTADGRAAGVGHPAEGGWNWTPRDELAPEIALAIDILQNKQIPAYVPLPVSIQ